MKNSFALALAAQVLFQLTLGTQAALAQAAAEFVPVQNAGYTDQGENLAKTFPKADGELTPYQIQEQAIQKGLNDNAIPAQKVADYPASENYNNNFNNKQNYSGGAGVGGSRMRGMAAMAGRMLARTAQVTLPTAGMVLLGTALNRGAMGNMYPMARHPGFGQAGLGGNGMQPGFNQFNGMQNAAMNNYGGMAGMASGYGAGYGNAMYTGH